METQVEELPTQVEEPTPQVEELTSQVEELTSQVEELPPVPTTTPNENVKEIAITDVVIDNENMALNIIIAFTQIAHRRNAYNIDETAKLAEAINFFKPKPQENKEVSSNE